MMKNIVGYIAKFLPLGLFVLALFIVHHELKAHEFSDLLKTLSVVSPITLLIAFGLMLVNYIILSGYDWLALRYTGHQNEVPLSKILMTSFIGYGLSNNTGHAWASGGSIRYKFYSAFKIPGWDIAKISLFLALTYVVGVVTLGFIGVLILPSDLRGALENPNVILLMTVLCGGFLFVYWACVLFRRKPFSIKNVEISLPSPKMALGQTFISCLDLVFSSLVLWVFVKDIPNMGFEIFLIIFVVAQVFGLVSQVPGGLGVFEGAFIWLTGPLFGDVHPQILSALIYYRVIYYFVPLALAGALLVFHELYASRHKLKKAGDTFSNIMSSTVPHVLSILLFFSGGVLLLSGATPSIPENIEWLRDILPLPVIEFSHLIGSVVGILLLFLARGVRLRLDAAWYGSLILLALGIGASFLKGFDWQEASILSFMFLGLWSSKRYFYRQSSLMQVSLDPSWIMMIAVIVIGATWIGFFSFQNVNYSDDLWWQFSYKNDASRFLRSLIVIAVTLMAVVMMKLLSVSRPKLENKASTQDLIDVLPIIQASNHSEDYLALLGDKRIFWSSDKTAFIAYGVSSKYWIAMGDPVGDKKAFEELLWSFKEEADRYGSKAVFYQVNEDYLALYLDVGFVMLKMGEVARISLFDFDLIGKKRENMRGATNKLSKVGFTFEVIDQEQVRANLTRIREISDLWIARKNTNEKGFSLGFFEEEYICKTRMAIVKDESGIIVAFANLWELDSKQELSLDLMRYDPETPHGIMDYLFAQLMLWGRVEGYQWFCLGTAPLSGLERRPLAPLWHKIGATVFDRGEDFYNFEGLYKYKAKFEPEWSSRYLAVPPGLSAPMVLIRTASLISGGFKEVFTK